MQDPSIPLNHLILQLIAEIDQFKGQWQALKNLSPEHLQQLRKVATIESVGSSTRIEGAKLTDIQVETLLSNVNTMSFKTRDEQEVAGYAEAMDIIYQSHEDLSLTENHICQLHQILLRHSKKDERHRGRYKTLYNNMVAKNADGNEIEIVFKTASPLETPQEMTDLVRWANKALMELSIHPLLMIAVFKVIFLAIHPFQDGNGRLSRIMTTLLLLRAGYEYVPYASLENIIEENKDLYYKALRRTQVTLKTSSPDWDPWITFFLRCLKKQTANLSVKIKNKKKLQDGTRPLLSNQILKLLEANESITMAQLVNSTGANRNTLKVRLRELVASGDILRHGNARNTWYSLNQSSK